ncbi:antitoxin VbhA family protein [Bradyrhizobium sp. LLZ17]|uniref:Antitoxin VbhA family protein n=1 Tax=Bradyrhizobium sp. LLZ17 TaxID=3239388 RepID=A0AB39XR23_9BRAD
MSDDDLESRAKAVMNAVAITRMEGGEPSAFVREQLARYAAGEISADEMRQNVLRHHGVRHDV